jgi:hypothetical protein
MFTTSVLEGITRELLYPFNNRVIIREHGKSVKHGNPNLILFPAFSGDHNVLIVDNYSDDPIVGYFNFAGSNNTVVDIINVNGGSIMQNVVGSNSVIKINGTELAKLSRNFLGNNKEFIVN